MKWKKITILIGQLQGFLKFRLLIGNLQQKSDNKDAKVHSSAYYFLLLSLQWLALLFLDSFRVIPKEFCHLYGLHWSYRLHLMHVSTIKRSNLAIYITHTLIQSLIIISHLRNIVLINVLPFQSIIKSLLINKIL